MVSWGGGPAEAVGPLHLEVGDLVVRHGVTVHAPTGREFSHPVAVSLIAGHVLGVEVVLSDAEGRAARRLRAWLRGAGSSVRVVARSSRRYALVAAAPPGRRRRTA